MTMGVGAHIWERFGHNAIGVRDRSQGTDVVYNYGTFDFMAPGFVANFLKGRMLYWLDTADADRTIRFYQETLRRSIYIQELNLTPSQRVELRNFSHGTRGRRTSSTATTITGITAPPGSATRSTG